MKLFLFIQTGQSVGIMAYFPFILILAIMYFLMIRPQAKRQKEKQEMIQALKKGDKIVTIGMLKIKAVIMILVLHRRLVTLFIIGKLI